MYTTSMQTEWDRALERWQQAGLLDAASVERIRSFEQSRTGPPGSAMARDRRPGLWRIDAHRRNAAVRRRALGYARARPAIHAGGPDGRRLAPRRRVHGRLTARPSPSRCTESARRRSAAGIFLARQIFNLQAHWPSGVLLWAAGAWVGWILRRDWLQFAMAAILTPFWLSGEWIESFPFADVRRAIRVLVEGLTLTLWFTSPRARASTIA